MFTGLFFLTCISIVLFGLGFVLLTLRHHYNESKKKKKTNKKTSQLADSSLPS